MDYQTLYAKTVVDLRKLAKDMQVKLPAGASKALICEMLAAVGDAPTAAQPAPIAETPRKRGRPRKNPDQPAPAESESPAPTEALPESEGASTLPSAETSAVEKPEPLADSEPVQRRFQPARSPMNAKHTGTFRRPASPQFRTGQGINRTGKPAPGSYAPRYPKQEADTTAPTQERSAESIQNPGGSSNPRSEYNTSNQAVIEMLSSGGCMEGAGILELHPDGYGFLRANNYLPGANDVYVSMAQIHRFALRSGDYVEGKTRPQREGDRYSAMMYIDRVNGMPPDQNARRPKFEYLVPIYPDQRIRLETPVNGSDIALRLTDMLAPIGKGQRGMIVSPPKAGKTTFLKKIANAITDNHPEIHLIVLLIDERPEEVTDMKRSISGEVVYSTFDEAPENHTRVSEMVLDRAQRLVEHGKDVVILLDSITRLARAYNLVIPPTGRSLSGGLDPGALHKPKRFFGAARNIENGGSLTIIATALVDTGSRMDDIIFEEFKGTGNMELHLDRRLSDRRIFPAIDMYRSGTRREELLLSPAELDCEYQVRKILGSSGNQEAVEQLISGMEKSATNEEFFSRLKGWSKAFEKDGFTLSNKPRQ